jgi:hypothetical protein
MMERRHDVLHIDALVTDVDEGGLTQLPKPQGRGASSITVRQGRSNYVYPTPTFLYTAALRFVEKRGE